MGFKKISLRARLEEKVGKFVHARTFTGRKGNAKTQLSSHNLSSNNKILQHKFTMDLNKPDTVKDGEGMRTLQQDVLQHTLNHCFPLQKPRVLPSDNAA